MADSEKDLFKDYPLFDDDSLIDLRGGVLTQEAMEDTWKKIMEYYNLYPETHHPDCDVITQKSIYCNCGTRPNDPIFKAAIEELDLIKK